MKRSRALRQVVWCGVALAAFGCAQITGLTGDYRHADEAESGTSGAPAEVIPNGGAAGELETGGSAGSGGSISHGGTNDSGGTAPSGGSNGNAGSGGSTSSGGSGGSGGNAGSGGSVAGAAGSGGGSSIGPVRIGFSEFHDSAAGADNASSHLANASFAKPAGTAAGDLLLVFFGADHSLSNLSGTDLEPRGWTLIDQHQDYGTDGQAAYLMYKFASAAEPDPIVFADINSAPSGNGVQGLLSVYRGVNAKAPVNAYEVSVFKTGQQNVTKAVTTTPALTTSVPNCLLIAGLSPDSAVDAPIVTAWPQGFTENQTSVVNPLHPYPYGWANIYSAERHLVSAGGVPASSFSWSFTNATEYYGSLSFVLALAP